MSFVIGLEAYILYKAWIGSDSFFMFMTFFIFGSIMIWSLIAFAYAFTIGMWKNT